MDLAGCTIQLTDRAEADARTDAVRQLLAFNEAKAGQPADQASFSALLLASGGEVIGGLWADVRWRWLTIGTLFVPEALRGRGLGRELTLAAEAEAVRRGCIGSTTETYSFQAPGFYERLGYAIAGEISDYPEGHRRCLFTKRLAGTLLRSSGT